MDKVYSLDEGTDSRVLHSSHEGCSRTGRDDAVTATGKPVVIGVGEEVVDVAEYPGDVAIVSGVDGTDRTDGVVRDIGAQVSVNSIRTKRVSGKASTY